MNKHILRLLIALATPFVLVALLAALLYFPPVQRWAVKRAAAYASEQTGMHIAVGSVGLAFPLDLTLGDVSVIAPVDSTPTRPDTVAIIGRSVVSVQVLPLLGSEVMVDELRLQRLQVNTTSFIDNVRISGKLDELRLAAHGIDLKSEHVAVDEAATKKGHILIELADTAQTDTTRSDNHWRIAIERLALSDTRLELRLPGDTLRVAAMCGDARATSALIDLEKGLYQVDSLAWSRGTLDYTNRFAPATEGFDANHISLSQLQLRASGIRYADSRLDMRLLHSQFLEQCGLRADTLRATIMLDSTRLVMSDMRLVTPESALSATVDMALNAFADSRPGQLSATLHGGIGKQDLLRFMTTAPAALRRGWPNYPLRIDGSVAGNMQRLTTGGLHVKLPTAFDIHMEGWLAQLTDIDRLKARVNLRAKTQQIGFLAHAFAPDLEVRLPAGMSLTGLFNVDGPRYDGRFTFAEGSGRVAGTAAIDTRTMAYQANLTASRLAVSHFMPSLNMTPLSGHIVAKGRGTDLLSPSTTLTADAKLQQLGMSGYRLEGLTATARMAGGRIWADIVSHGDLLEGHVSVNALTSRSLLDATIAADVSRANLQALHISDVPLVAALCGHVDVKSDLKQRHSVQGLVSDVTVTTATTQLRPEDVVVDILTRPDTTHAVVYCGDFHMALNGHGGYEQLLSQATRLQEAALKQLRQGQISEQALRKLLPTMQLQLTTGRDNFIAHLLQHYGYEARSVEAHMLMSPSHGLDGTLAADSLVAQGILIDTLRAAFVPTDTTLSYRFRVANNKKNPQYRFLAVANGALSEHTASINTQVYDEQRRLGIDLGLAAMLEQEGIRLHMSNLSPVLGYTTFAANADNYIFLDTSQRLSADLKLRSNDGAGVQIYTDDDNTEALQDVTLSLSHFDLAKITRVVPYLPRIEGVLDGDFHAIMTPTEQSVSVDAGVEKMVYEGSPLGTIGTQFVYMPRSDGSHFVDGVLSHEGNEVGQLRGSYRSEGDGGLDATLKLARTPLHFINGFIPDGLFGLRGYAEGTLTVKGPLSRPQVDGEVYLDEGYVYSEPYGVEMKFADDPVRIVGSHLLFENFEVFASNNRPLNVQGSFDFSDLDHMAIDVRMRADNFMLINAKENPRSEAFGKAFVNFLGMMRGPVDNMTMRGRLDVLSGTDMTYVLRESELTTDSELDELVRFTDLNDDTDDRITKPKPTGLDMEMQIHIDEAAHILATLNAEKTNYIDLMGGGSLTMSYNPSDNLRLNGRYTLSNGEMKYSLPIIPLKTFTIQDGSYLEFTGDPFDPTLHITATETVKAAVGSSEQTGRQVEFDCGVQLTQTLAKPGIQFIIKAPNDVSMQDELNTMSTEEQGKIAVAMLASGLYLADGNTSGFSMNTALSSFLNSEINNIAGAAMRSVGLDLGLSVDNSTNASGDLHTDYSFKFSKRLWNNRLNVIVGGQVSTGADLGTDTHDNTFFDNVELQYRLNQGASQYLRAFYDNNTYDWLEGHVGQFGVGFLWKRKLRHFKDIFKLKDATQSPIGRTGQPPVQGDSTARQTTNQPPTATSRP